MADPAGRSTRELFSLSGRTAVVTGAAGYLGRVFSGALAEAGATVVMMGRGDKLAKAADQLRAVHGVSSVETEAVDFSDTAALRASFDRVGDRYATIDVLVNNAFSFSRETGFNDPSGRLESLSKGQWMHALESGVYWHALATQTVIGRMVKQGTGSIINISSMYGIVSPDPSLYEGTDAFNPPSYGAAKAALLALTRYTASFYGRHGVRCNALLPGAFPNLGGDSYNAPRNETLLQIGRAHV
mgnify:CR=1 FL=1